MRFALALCLFGAGCVTGYEPHASRSIRMILKDGTAAFTKNGVVVQKGFLGSGLSEAMADVPQAQRHAEAFRKQTIAGFVVSLVALPVVAAGAVVAILGMTSQREGVSSGTGFPYVTSVGFGMEVLGLAGAILGAAVTSSAQPHLYDALNIYNDAVEEALRRPITEPAAPAEREPDAVDR